jgi:hypothetical protein
MKNTRLFFSIFAFLFLFIAGNVFSQTARLQIIHNSPDAATASVDVFVNGALFESGFDFRTATPFMDVAAGVDLNIVVAPAGAGIENGVGPVTINLVEGETYIAIANGIVSTTGYDPAPGFSLDVFPTAREAATDAGNTDVLAFHGSTDAPIVSVWETGVGAGEIISDFAYGDFAGYLELGTMDYVLEVRDASGEVTVAAYAAPLATLGLEGAALTIVASGFLDPSSNSDGPVFGLFVALPSGGDLIGLPLVEDEDPVVVGFPFFDDFEDTDTYSNWTIIDGSGSGFVWNLGNTTNFVVNDPVSGSYAFIDSDDAGTGNNVWTILQTPVIDLTGYQGGALTLSFDHHYRQISSQVAYVKVSSDGESWETVATYNSDQGSSSGFSGPFNISSVTESIILDGFEDGDHLYVRFEFDDNNVWGWYWLIDNVSVAEIEEIPMARLQIIHNSPDAATQSVDIFVNGELFESGLNSAPPHPLWMSPQVLTWILSWLPRAPALKMVWVL